MAVLAQDYVTKKAPESSALPVCKLRDQGDRTNIFAAAWIRVQAALVIDVVCYPRDDPGGSSAA